MEAGPEVMALLYGAITDTLDREALAQSVNDRDEAVGVSRIAGPHLGADRPAVTVDENAKDHLPPRSGR
jgi:hypothetical protein